MRGSEYCLAGLVFRDFKNVGIGLICLEARRDAAYAVLFDGTCASLTVVSPFLFLGGWLLDDVLLVLR